ncbi:hypothetical protein NM688_g1526 [Phlebia brevispora]|uniref:Uncharacterized protein n=1 Tax=Phlebia brevispora TaxID=194682 RepID=A0ACC1TBB1_9APHY|nr:hypothetical protein NM688_g1526 [Phlebia brevispora]
MLTPPSPSTSPSLSPSDISTSRKRQRSLSMDSESSSSSPKRSVSLDPNHDGHDTPRPKDMSTLSISDAKHKPDIDAYMAEQGEESVADIRLDAVQTQPSDGTPALQVTPPLTDPESTPASRLNMVEDLRKAQMKIGDTWYLVSRKWFRRWQKACVGEEDKEGAIEEKDVGPVDNSNLVDMSGNITAPCTEGIDVEFVPEQAWNLLAMWYGQPRYPLPRKVIGRGIMQEPALEVRPPQLHAYVLLPDLPTRTTASIPPQIVTVSVTDTVTDVRKALIQSLFNTEQAPTRRYRVWKFEDTPPETTVMTTKNIRETRASILEDSSKMVGEALIENGDVFAVESELDGKWLISEDDIPLLYRSPPGTNNVDLPPTPQSTQGLIEAPKPLFNSNKDFFSKLQTNGTSSQSGTANGKLPLVVKPTPSKDPRPAPKVCTLVPGTLGLGNMGNTCFMNSAIQCLAHTKELKDYFLTGVFEDELNPDNPLGMKGAIAEAFGALLRRIWAPAGPSTSYSPREFKQVLAKFAPQFSGYQQHDSQELVAFLLDGLHEDLNRVLKKPYVEKPDWEGGGDKELVALAKESWEGYMKRNDSVIVDLFQGQYQSTLVCPECKKVSITFDPFMYLTLPLPVKKKWKHTIRYVPWDIEKPHLEIPIELNRDLSFKDVRNLLGRWMDVNPDNLLTLEVFNHRFYKNLDDHTAVSEISDNDDVMCFELPCHAQQSRTYKKQDDDPFIVPVFLSESPRTRQTYSSPALQMFGKPFVIVVDQQQAASVEAMYDLVVNQLQRWTKHVRDLWQWEASSVSTPMEEVSITISEPPRESITEITENGDVVTVQEAVPEEGDIADEKGIVVRETDDDTMDTTDDTPRRVGCKKDLFRMHLQPSNTQYAVGYGSWTPSLRSDAWSARIALAQDGDDPVLLRPGDAFLCEFDENLESYYFGEKSGSWEHSTWESWEEFIHPELKAAREAAGEKKTRGISLQDCLEEFTKEEQLGEDDLWYCPQCKKHQQATKRFDLWSVPDVLVVHLKRFSSSRTLRDKIDVFVDFPVDGLDLTQMVMERQVAHRLAAAGEDLPALGLTDVKEPLIYDLYAVDEHLGGLGGGHYRAYAFNEGDNKWHHFDDSYVSISTATASVNSNAYLLFYRRRTSRPLGGKTHELIETARSKIEEASTSATIEEAGPSENIIQLPTPPSEGENLFDSQNQTLGASPFSNASRLNSAMKSFGMKKRLSNWDATSSKSHSSSASSPPPLESDEPPSFFEAQHDTVLQSNLDSMPQVFPDPLALGSNHSSPSSTQAEFDRDQDSELDGVELSPATWPSHSAQVTIRLREGSASPDDLDDYSNPPNASEDDSDV